MEINEWFASDGATADSAAQLTGFAPRSWEWSHLTMSNTHSTLTIPSSGIYDLQLLMREDGLRVDKMLLITDTNYIPTGNGPTASNIQFITDTVSSHLQTHTATYAYDNLYRLTEAIYTGAITGTYQYRVWVTNVQRTPTRLTPDEKEVSVSTKLGHIFRITFTQI